MDRIALYPCAKINWLLNITNVRPDGFHELDMLMQTIALHDELILSKSDDIALCSEGVFVESGDNLVLKAIHALRRYTGKDISVRAQLKKNIPARAGLGGGSSDCAFAIYGINELYGLGLSLSEMADIGFSLGSDVPFFFYGGLCRVRGRGELIEKLTDAPECSLVITHVGGGLSTKDVYAMYDKAGSKARFASYETVAECLYRQDYKALNINTFNDLQAPASLLMPQIEKTIEILNDAGASFSMMSGSGSAVYGVFKDKAAAERAAAAIPDSYLTRTSRQSLCMPYDRQP
ncbi:MAG: 4-(cytidine 5'-diphospho)-2-C-methyl-D-erythritol kinase [Clostridia bacterium]|nr:4-(cytidine 5'-diphospho)-2-C-methyl-D-erythritol kinase [Clostridia bacterium]